MAYENGSDPKGPPSSACHKNTSLPTSSAAATPHGVAAALDVLYSLFMVLPALRGEISGVLAALDAGEGIQIEGLQDALVRTGLEALFLALGLHTEAADDGQGVQYKKPTELGDLQTMLAPALSVPSSSSSSAMAAIGPELPAHRAHTHTAHSGQAIGLLPAPIRAAATDVEEDEEDEGIGPRVADAAAPGSIRALPLLGDVEGKDERKAMPLLPVSFPSKSSQMRAAAAVPSPPAHRAATLHEGWMTEGEWPAELASLGGGSGGKPVKPAQLPARLRIDKSAPGYGNPSGQVGAGSSMSSKSLMDIHSEMKRPSGPTTSGGWKPFDRERDVLGGTRMAGPGAAARIIQGPSALTEKFTAGTYETSFL